VTGTPDADDTVGGTRGFLPAVEGLRACAAVGVVVTHVAFQTGMSGGITGRILGRFDLAVAVFFALSGFLLWRGHAAAARGLRSRPSTGHYLRSRIVRIMPGYLVAVVVIMTLLPEVKADFTVWLANLTLTQIYVPLTLTAGLTQMWSLSVEMSFYLALPLLALLARRLPVRAGSPRSWPSRWRACSGCVFRSTGRPGTTCGTGRPPSSPGSPPAWCWRS
jgi:peptidoglycan/LPS O-acetylase OafA/YrhL